MRITLTIDDDILQAARELAAVEGVSAGRALSDLARAGLKKSKQRRYETGSGFPLIPGGRRVTTELVDRLANRE